MDVVKKAIEKMRGRVEIRSMAGQGTTFIIRLPLTLAIIDGMIVRVGKEKYIIPTLNIIESFVPQKDQYFTVENQGELIMTRGELIPLIRLGRIFNIDGDAKVTDTRLRLVRCVTRANPLVDQIDSVGCGG